MDSAGFDQWIHWWSSEIQKVSSGPWLLIMDNCGGHEPEILFLNIRVEFIPPGTTEKYQTLDLGLITNAKIRYRSLLILLTLEIFERLVCDDLQFKENSGYGRWGTGEGHFRMLLMQWSYSTRHGG